MTRHHTKKKKNKKSETSPVKNNQVEAEIQAYIHTHIHTDIFQKSCILIPNTTKNNYNMFLQQLKKLLSRSNKVILCLTNNNVLKMNSRPNGDSKEYLSIDTIVDDN